MRNIMIMAGTAIALLSAAPALADPPSYAGTTFYGDLGYSNLDNRGVDVGAVTGRLGARFGRYLGVEGEASGGVTSDHVNNAAPTVGARLDNQYAGYAVGYLPLTRKLDLFARIGYGESRFRSSASAPNNNFASNSVNFGGGGQYMFDGHNGVRADYTRYDYNHSGGDADVWALAYVRKF